MDLACQNHTLYLPISPAFSQQDTAHVTLDHPVCLNSATGETPPWGVPQWAAPQLELEVF